MPLGAPPLLRMNGLEPHWSRLRARRCWRRRHGPAVMGVGCGGAGLKVDDNGGHCYAAPIQMLV